MRRTKKARRHTERPEGSAEAAEMAGESAKAPAEGAATFAGAPPAAPADGPGSREDEPPIRLFDDDTPPARRGSRTRMFRTGSGTAARINMNETETLRSIDEAKRRQREKEAQRQHEAYVQRQKRQRRRKRAMKRMAANIAFVSFIVIAVLAALYFTFLLKDIVVSGNETYSDEYIIASPACNMAATCCCATSTRRAPASRRTRTCRWTPWTTSSPRACASR